MDVRDPVGIEAMLPARRSGVRIQFRRSRRFCFPKKKSRPALGPAHLPIQWVSGFFPGSKAARA